MNEHLIHGSLPDGGPLYVETVTGRWPVEPWNAFSSLAFILPVLFWLYKAWRGNQPLPHIIAAGVLLTGSLGSFSYHAFRSSSFFLLLDVVPIYLLAYGSALLLWKRITGKWVIACLLPAAAYAADLLVFYATPLPIQTRNNLTYSIMGLLVLTPLILLLVQTRFRSGIWVLAAAASYIAAFQCRIFDAWDPPLLPMGTHWMWHIGGAMGTFCLGQYVFTAVAEQKSATA